MSLTITQHDAWEKILSIANNAGFKEGGAAGNVPSGTGLTTLISMYQTAEGGSHPQATQTVNRVTEPGKR